jgi:hypothetical protein
MNQGSRKEEIARYWLDLTVSVIAAAIAGALVAAVLRITGFSGAFKSTIVFWCVVAGLLPFVCRATNRKWVFWVLLGLAISLDITMYCLNAFVWVPQIFRQLPWWHHVLNLITTTLPVVYGYYQYNWIRGVQKGDEMAIANRP